MLGRARYQAVRRASAEALGSTVKEPSCDFIPQTFGDPDFDEGLPSDTQPAGFFVQGMNHPAWKVHIHALGYLIGPLGARKVEKLRNVFPGIESPIQFFSFHTILSPRSATVSRK